MVVVVVARARRSIFTTRAELNALAAAGALPVGQVYLITDETPDRMVIATATAEYINFLPVSTYRPPAPLGDLRTIAEENTLEGYPPGSWNNSDTSGDTGAFGFSTVMSVRAGDTIEFKIHSGNTPYALEIVRLGWYGGDGARLVDNSITNSGTTQPNSTQRNTGEGGVGSRECSNWIVTDRWSVPLDATHGVYLAIIKRAGRASFTHVGPFIVENTHGDNAEILCKFSDHTWRAYNGFGTINDPLSGKSLYGIGVGTFSQGGRCHDMSYDAPMMVNAIVRTAYWNGERPIHSWLEQQGYSVHYVSCYDVDRNPALLAGRKVIISAGHDEYWSQAVRDAWDAAIAGGSHAIVFSGNTMLWRVRQNGRIMTCYKDSHTLDGVGTRIDPGLVDRHVAGHPLGGPPTGEHLTGHRVRGQRDSQRHDPGAVLVRRRAAVARHRRPPTWPTRRR